MSDEVTDAPSAAEQWYEAEIAPALMEIGRKCEARGVPFVAVVEWEPEQRGRTELLPPGSSLAMVMLRHCAATAPNIDSYIIGFGRYCREQGIDTSSSIVMNRMEGK